MDVKIEITQSNLDDGAVTIFVETEPGQLGWNLPDGTRVYYKNAFLKNGTEVTPIFLGMKGENYLYLLEPLHGERDFYHVVEFKKTGDEYIFVKGYTYTKNELIKGNVDLLGKGMALKAAKQEAQKILDAYSLTEGSTPDTVAASLKADLESKLTANWSFTVEVTFTTKEIEVPVPGTGDGSETGDTGGSGDTEDPGEGGSGEITTKTIIDEVQITVDITEVVGTGETPETAAINKTIDVETQQWETTLTGEDLTSTVTSTGANTGDLVRGISFAKGVLGNRDGLIFINESGGLTVRNGNYYFELDEYDGVHGIYVAGANQNYTGFELARYNELLGKYFVLSSDQNSIQVYKLAESGSGEITSTTGEPGSTTYTLNGGYHRVNGGYLFVDDPAVTDANAGILYLLDRAVVVSTDGQVYPVAIEGNQIGAGQNMTDVTISFAPGMQQMRDSEGNPLYNNNGVISTEVTASSIPVYDLRPVAKKDGSGNQLYTVFNMTKNQYEINSRTGTREFILLETLGYNNILFGPRYKVSPIYVNLPGFTIVRPVAGGFSVTYSTPSTFDIPLDDKGYGIINENMRVLTRAEGQFAAGTVLYLDDGKNVIALLTPDGKFYRYEQDTFYTPNIPEDQEIYTAYRGTGSGDNLDLIADISAGSQTMLHEVMTGLYMSVPDEGSSTAGPMNSFYADADFFGFDSAGDLVLLAKQVLDTPYEATGEADWQFNGATVMNIYDAQSDLQLRVLELSGGRIVFLFEDNTWIDSLGNTGFIPRAVNRTLSSFEGDSQIQLNRVQAGNVNISFAGANTILTDNGSEDNINIIADNVTIASQDGGNVFSEDNRLVIAPNTSDIVNLKLVKTNAGEAFNASAYVVASGVGDKVNLHDTEIGSGGLLDLLVPTGNAELNNVGINTGGNIDLSVSSGDITMNNVDVSGSMTATTDAGAIIINTSNINSTGTLNVETGSGDIALNGVNVGGNMSADTQAGNLDLNDVNIISGGTLGVVTELGDVTVDQVTADGTLQVTAANGNLLMKDEDSILTIGPNSTAGEGDTWLDISGDIGSAQQPFKVNILPDETGSAQPLNIKKVVNIYLKQETGSATSDDTLPTNGRDKNGTVGNYDEATNGMENDDEQVKVTMPAQTPEEIAAQLSNGTFTKEQLLAFISGILSGQEIKVLLGIEYDSIEALVASLETMEITELAELATRLNLGVAEPESKLDLTVLDGEDSEAIKNLALQLSLPADADKETILAELRTRLGLEDTASIEEIKAAYESYYEEVLAQYRTDVINSYRASIESILNTDSKLSDADIKYLFDLGLSEEEAAITVLLAAALAAQQPVVIGTDGDGNPVYQKAVDENGDPLYVEGTDENGNPVMIPVYVMESRLADDKLFEAYWQSLTESQKQELIKAAWALADYPEPVDNTDQYRVLVLNIGESTGSSNISNLGDIVITQQTGIFTAEEIFSRYGDVSITGPEITGVDNKTNVTGEDISLTATTGSITGLDVEERS